MGYAVGRWDGRGLCWRVGVGELVVRAAEGRRVLVPELGPGKQIPPAYAQNRSLRRALHFVPFLRQGERDDNFLAAWWVGGTG